MAPAGTGGRLPGDSRIDMASYSLAITMAHEFRKTGCDEAAIRGACELPLSVAALPALQRACDTQARHHATSISTHVAGGGISRAQLGNRHRAGRTAPGETSRRRRVNQPLRETWAARAERQRYRPADR